MGKDKLRRFKENLTFACLVQPAFEEAFRVDHPLRGRWREDFFRNTHPIVLELGCGRGEYTVALARKYPGINVIGVDIKGARMWRGAKTATEEGLRNAAFLRTRIELIGSFFAPGEVDEIWITFPDPQLRKNRVKKRLTSPSFLAAYAGFLKPDGKLHLKSDSRHLHDYTRAVIARNELPLWMASTDIYAENPGELLTGIQTAYEQQYLSKGVNITYLQFGLGNRKRFDAPDFEPDAAL